MDFVDVLPPILESGFINRPPLTRVIPPDNTTFILYEAVMFDVGGQGSGDRIVVPAGFITDYASVPRPLWWLVPPQGRWSGAAIIHDYLYVIQARSRAEADAIFKE